MEATSKSQLMGQFLYIPAAFGGVCASVVIRDLLGYPIKMEKKPKMVAREKKQKKRNNTPHYQCFMVFEALVFPFSCVDLFGLFSSFRLFRLL
jgi:hypothetical protein